MGWLRISLTDDEQRQVLKERESHPSACVRRRYTFAYDVMGQTKVTASTNSQRVTWTYDEVGAQRSLNASVSGRFTSLYDLAGQLTSQRNPSGERTSFSYDDAGRRTIQRNGNGTRVSMAYDAASQATQVIQRRSAGTTLQQLDYRYDNAGNRNVMIEGAGTARVTWSYDKQNQLTGEYRTGTNAYRQTFAYDPAGNRTLKNADGARTTCAYDAANQLRYAQTLAGRTTYAFDLTGNQRLEQPPTGNRTTTTWNYENQPTQYLLPAGSPVTMSYNGDNRRVISQQGATSTKFVWDATTDAYLSELDGTNAVQAVYTNEPQHYGSVLSQRRSSTSHWLHADALGTTRLLTGSTQTMSDTYLLDAWGNSVASTGTSVNPFRWVGKYGYYSDNSTGQVYVRARMYQPTVARWKSVDPFPLVWTRKNRYAFATSSPVLRIDPSGLLDCYCSNWHCDRSGNGPSFNDYLNNVINDNLERALLMTIGKASCPCEYSANWIEDFRHKVRDLLAKDIGSGYGTPPSVITSVEGQLHEFEDYVSSIWAGPRKPYKTADCMRISCGGKTRCIGTDKIGHFFQQGMMGWELLDAGYSVEFVRTFFEFTEGLSDINYVGDFSFYGFDDYTKFQQFKGKWGPLQHSKADIAANLAGTKFYENLPSMCKCLYDRMSDVVVGATDVRMKGCFDICDYVDDFWEE